MLYLHNVGRTKDKEIQIKIKRRYKYETQKNVIRYNNRNNSI